MKKVVSMPLVFTLALFVLSIGAVRGDDGADLNGLQPLWTNEMELYETVKNDPAALHKFVVSRIYFRKLDQLCADPSKECYKIAPPLPEDIDANYAVTFDEQILYLQLLVVQELNKDKQ